MQENAYRMNKKKWEKAPDDNNNGRKQEYN